MMKDLHDHYSYTIIGHRVTQPFLPIHRLSMNICKKDILDNTAAFIERYLFVNLYRSNDDYIR